MNTKDWRIQTTYAKVRLQGAKGKSPRLLRIRVQSHMKGQKFNRLSAASGKWAQHGSGREQWWSQHELLYSAHSYDRLRSTQWVQPTVQPTHRTYHADQMIWLKNISEEFLSLKAGVLK
jgi:hypothetical protein